MAVLRILVLCVSAALICMSIRTMHPQVATAVALAASIGALMLSTGDITAFSQALQTLEDYANQSDVQLAYLIRICGIAIVAELASDICRDSGEAALAHRIDAGVKLGIAASALPTTVEILQRIASLLS